MSKLDNPILKVEGRAADLTPKPGGGSTPPPLVEVNDELMAELASQLDAVIAALPSGAKTGEEPAAMKVRLREQAWAKSNRPNEFLSSSRLPVAGASAIGELLVPSTLDSLLSLRHAVTHPASKKSRYHISTFERFELWSEEDVFRALPADQRTHLLQTAIERGASFRVELFPWASSRDVAQTALERAGVELITWRSHSRRALAYVRTKDRSNIQALARLSSVRHVSVTPMYSVPSDLHAQGFRLIDGTLPPDIGSPEDFLPVVGIIDSGTNAASLAPWIVGREIYELPPDTDHVHGTFVAGLVASPRQYNGCNTKFPAEGSRILDVHALPRGLVAENVLLDRIAESVTRHPDVHVWNCSFAATTPNHPPSFGAFAMQLDKLSDDHRVLFVQASGNYETRPGRPWPCTAAEYPADGLACPAESARGLAVGSVAHIDGYVKEGCPAPYSRRGPGPAFVVKPELVHFGGNTDASGAINGTGVVSIVPGDRVAESIGTSFSTPIVSTIAANVWQGLESTNDVYPELVKGLVIHAAALESPERSEHERHYYGHGVPPDVVSALFCDPCTFTLLFEAHLVQGIDWHRTPFPIPQCLRTNTGALRAEIVMTLSYAPPLDPSFADEYLQHEIDASFGTYTLDPTTNKWKHEGKVPVDRPVGRSTTEKAMIEQAFKWTPVKVHRARFPKGVTGETWRLKLSLTRRKEIEEEKAQRAYVIVSLKGLEPELPVYADGIRALRAVGWTSTPIAVPSSIRVRSA